MNIIPNCGKNQNTDIKYDNLQLVSIALQF